MGLVYADDTYVYFSGPSLNAGFPKIQRAIHDIACWCTYRKLRLNPGICAAIVFLTKKATPKIHKKFVVAVVHRMRGSSGPSYKML